MIRSARSDRKTLTEVAQQEQRQAITDGVYHPGSQLPTEAELCEMLGVSRTVVRESLQVLEDEPLIYSCEYHLPDTFDSVVWRRGPARGASIEGAQ